MKSTHELIDEFCAIDLSDLSEKQIADHGCSAISAIKALW
jgi:hypothetical protein